MLIEFNDTDIKWCPYHSKWGYACGRVTEITFPTKEECDFWIKESPPSFGEYKSFPLLKHKQIMEAIIK